MWTLSSLFSQPSPNTAETTQFRAVWTKAGIPQLFHANKTSEDLCYALHTLLVHLLQFGLLDLAVVQGFLPGPEVGQVSEGAAQTGEEIISKTPPVSCRHAAAGAMKESDRDGRERMTAGRRTLLGPAR